MFSTLKTTTVGSRRRERGRRGSVAGVRGTQNRTDEQRWGELFKLLSTGSPAAVLLIVAVLVLSVTVSVIYTTAFVQGRSISFWPLSIGERPKSVKIDHEEAESRSSASVTSAESSNPVVDRGTMLRAASGKTHRSLSAFYGGANATLYRPRTVAGPPLSRRCLAWTGAELTILGVIPAGATHSGNSDSPQYCPHTRPRAPRRVSLHDHGIP